ncbi:TPR repeat-containing protein YrrB [bacterium HR34]|nr:TPR repeat-containing protein YrrB [bacterium HR34]
MKIPLIINLMFLQPIDYQSFLQKLVVITTITIPLFFLPFTLNFFEFNKQLILSISGVLSILIWLVYNFKTQKLEVRKTTIYLPIALLFLALTLSTISSKWPGGSFWGWPADTAGSMLTIMSYILIFLVAINIFKEETKTIYLLFSIVVSSLIASIIFLWSYIQLYLAKFIQGYTPIFQIFSTMSSNNILSVFLAVTTIICMSLLVISKGIIKKTLYATLIFNIVSIFLINFFIAWIILTIGTVIFLLFYMITAKFHKEKGFIIVPMVFLALSIVFGLSSFIGISNITSINGLIPASEFDYINYPHTLQVSKSAISESTAFGTGPGTYSYIFNKYKPDEIIQSPLWNLDLQKAPSYLLEILGTMGLFGFISFLLIIAFAVLNFIRFLRKSLQEVSSYNFILYAGIFSSFVASIAVMVLYYSNTVLSYLFWILLAVIVIVSNKDFKTFDLSEKIGVNLLNSFFVIVAIILSIIFFIKEGQRYAAELVYFKSLQLSQQNKIDEAMNKNLQAVQLWPNQPLFYLDYIQNVINKLVEINNNQGLKEDEKIIQRGQLLQSVNDTFQILEKINPNNYSIWRQRGYFYSNLIPIQGLENAAINSFEKVLFLYPKNVEVMTQIASLKLYKASLIQDNNEEKKTLLAEAKNYAEKAVSIKENYIPAYNQLAIVYNQEGNQEKVVETLQKALQVDPANIDIRFNLGVVYYNNKKYDKARNQFEILVGAFPNYSNARFYLGLTLARQGEIQKAIEQFKEVEKLNPNNEQVKEIIKKLEKGEPIFKDENLNKAPLENRGQPEQQTIPTQEQIPSQP